MRRMRAMKKGILYFTVALVFAGSVLGVTDVPFLSRDIVDYSASRTVEIKNVDNGCVSKISVFKDGKDVTEYFSAKKLLLKDNILVLNFEDHQSLNGEFTVVVDYYSGKSLTRKANLN